MLLAFSNPSLMVAPAASLCPPPPSALAILETSNTSDLMRTRQELASSAFSSTAISMSLLHLLAHVFQHMVQGQAGAYGIAVRVDVGGEEDMF